MEDIDVFYMDPTFIDLQVYSLWLEGLSGKTVYTSWVNATSALTTISALWVQVWVVHYGYTWLT